MNLTEFNSAQKEAVTLSHDPNKIKDVLIVAGAGSGKTRVVVYRIAYLCEVKGVSPSSILGVTFTKKAANEMQERLSQIVTKRTAVKLGTFHALAADLLRTFREESFDIIDDNDQNRMLRFAIKQLDLKDEVTLKEFKLWLSNQRNNCKDPEQLGVNDDAKISNFRAVAKKYREEKQQIGPGVLDFDDLLEHLVFLLKEKPAIQKLLHDRWKYILVDEYQDTNKRQFQIISLIRGDDTQLLQVGDEDQLIYSWRGANISHIMSSYEDSKRNPLVKCVMLNTNYRCSGNILSLANSVVSDNMERTGKELVPFKKDGLPIKVWQLPDCSQESDALANQMLKWSQDGYDYKDMVVLMRTNRMARPLERAMIMAGVPYKIHNGTALFETKEVRFIMSLLWLTESPEEIFHMQGVLDMVKMGIGPAKLLLLEGQRVEACVNWISLLENHPSYGGKQVVKDLVACYEDAKDFMELGNLVDAARTWLHGFDVMSYFKEEEKEKKSETIMTLFSVMEDYQVQCKAKKIHPCMTDFQEQRLLNDSLVDDDSQGVNLMTIHKAKGLEFKVGAIIGIQDGVFPLNSDSFADNNEEDWRLAYVAITRFMDDLILTRTAYRTGFNNLSECSSILDNHLETLMKKEVVICEYV